MIRFDEINAVANRAKSLALAVKRYEAKSDKLFRTESLKHAAKHAVDLANDAHYMEVMQSDLHAACVDAGLAEPKDAEEYEERTWRLSAWHEYKWSPAKPKRMVQ